MPWRDRTREQRGFVNQPFDVRAHFGVGEVAQRVLRNREGRAVRYAEGYNTATNLLFLFGSVEGRVLDVRSFKKTGQRRNKLISGYGDFWRERKFDVLLTPCRRDRASSIRKFLAPPRPNKQNKTNKKTAQHQCPHALFTNGGEPYPHIRLALL